MGRLSMTESTYLPTYLPLHPYHTDHMQRPAHMLGPPYSVNACQPPGTLASIPTTHHP